MTDPAVQRGDTSGSDARPALIWAVAVFVSAFLLFQIQPLISKAILPWFGGTPSVWTTCMLFFQTALFGGYVYAHLLSSRLAVRGQVGLHLALIVITVALLRVLPGDSWKPTGNESPTVQIVLLLGATVGLPYFLLATTGPLLQRWFSIVHPGRSPYRLYALSNAGSLIALLSYPFIVEPLLEMPAQAQMWSWGFWLFALLCAVCSWRLWGVGAGIPQGNPMRRQTRVPHSPAGRRYALWFALAMLASTMYLATTNQVCQDIAVVPFLWVMPLSLYLLSFILCFESDRWYRRRWWALATGGLMLGICWVMVEGSEATMWTQIGVYFAAMFAMCMMCHGELARLKPDPEHLTAFYLTLSGGGAAGGLFVAVIAPLVFPNFWEVHFSMLAAAVCVGGVLFDDLQPRSERRRPPILPVLVGVILIVAIGTVFVESVTNYRSAMAMTRSFYGVLEVEHDRYDDATVLLHGQIIHGLQLRESGMQGVPTTYYSRRTGVGRAMVLMQSRQDRLNVGLVGLGAGTMAAYGREGDRFRFYEINEQVARLARQHFTFLDATRANVEIVMGDARLSLSAEQPKKFDVIVLDAFAGDAIPTHLLTREAFAEYLRHWNDDGIIAVHISNLHFNLEPVADALADEYDLHTVTIFVPKVRAPVDPSSKWTLMARDAALLDAESLSEDVLEPQPERVLWTDSFSNLLQVLGD